MHQRLQGLDGIRGIAIILVILNHIPLNALYAHTPEILHPLWVYLLANGKIGVSLLFLLSGFLMAWLYPQPSSAVSFLSKRYLRIFPPFLVMVIALTIIRSWYFRPSPFLVFLTPFLIAGVAHLLWRFLAKLHQKFQIGRKVFYAFFGFQVLVAAWYVFGLQRISSAEYYIEWTKHAQSIAIALINGTLTLPLGRYVAQLDGVYWSLVLEVLFYLLYPTFIVHIVALLKQARWRWLPGLVGLAAVPFLYGMYVLGHRVLGFSMMQPHLFIYFLAGIAVANLYRAYEEKIEYGAKHWPILTSPLVIPFMLFLTLSIVSVFGKVPASVHPWVNLLWSVPLSFVMIVALVNDGAWSKFLSMPWLVTAGKYSFSLYLLHSLVVELLIRGKEPQTLLGAFVLIVATFVLSVLAARVFYVLLEQPYFTLRFTPSQETKQVKEKKKTAATVKATPTITQVWRPALVGTAVLTTVLVFGIYLGFRPPYAFFTTSISHQEGSDAGTTKVRLDEQTRRVPFTVEAANLGMVTTSLKTGEVKDENNVVNASDKAGHLQIRLLDDQQQELASSTFNVHELGESLYHPLGFPMVADAAGKTFYVEYQITRPDPSRYVAIVQKEDQLQSVYFLNKSELLKNPVQLTKHVFTKMSEPFVKASAVQVMSYSAPFVLMLWVAIIHLGWQRRSA